MDPCMVQVLGRERLHGKTDIDRRLVCNVYKIFRLGEEAYNARDGVFLMWLCTGEDEVDNKWVNDYRTRKVP
jgi:hypothetical protein